MTKHVVPSILAYQKGSDHEWAQSIGGIFRLKPTITTELHEWKNFGQEIEPEPEQQQEWEQVEEQEKEEQLVILPFSCLCIFDLHLQFSYNLLYM